MNQKSPKKFGLADIKKKLKTLSHADLMELIVSSYALSQDHKDFLARRVLMDEDDLDYYKEQLEEHLTPYVMSENANPISFSKAKKVISDYKRICKDQKKLIDLMLHYVEIGTDFAIAFNCDDPYFNSLRSVFAQTVPLLATYNIQSIKKFIARINILLEKAMDYYEGYHDQLLSVLEKSTLINSVKIPSYGY